MVLVGGSGGYGFLVTACRLDHLLNSKRRELGSGNTPPPHWSESANRQITRVQITDNMDNYCFRVKEQTSKVAHEIDDFHLPVRFNVAVVQVRVEHDDGKCQKEDRFRTAEVFHVLRIALAVPCGKRLGKYFTRRLRLIP